MKCPLTIVVLSFFSAGICLAGENIDFTDEKNKTSYSIGYQVGGDLDRQGVKVRPDFLLQGVQDAVGDRQPAMSAIEMHQTLVDLKDKVSSELGQDQPITAPQQSTE